MKNLILILTLSFFGSFGQHATAQKKEREVVRFQSNMHCKSCENKLFEHLKFEKGVKNLKVDQATNTIMVEFESGKASEKSISQAIEKRGYKADKITREVYEKLHENLKDPK